MTIQGHLSTDRLRLIPLTTAEADATHALWTRPEVRRFLWDDEIVPRTRTTAILEENERLFAERAFGIWSIRRRGEAELCGFGGYWHFREPPELELILGLAGEWWGLGYATEAGRALIDYAFDVLGFPAVRGSTDAPNERSIRLMERLGMRFERRAVVDGLDTVFHSVARAAAPFTT